MTRTRPNTFARLIGVTIGLAAAAVFVVSGRVQEGQAAPGAELALATGRSAELIVSPPGRVLTARSLRAGRPARAAVTLHNPTDVTLAVRPRLAGSVSELDELVRLRLVADRQAVFDGTLGALRRGRIRGFRVGSHQKARLAITASVPASADSDAAGQRAGGRIELLTKIVSGRT
jgi:hypothetical protein